MLIGSIPLLEKTVIFKDGLWGQVIGFKIYKARTGTVRKAIGRWSMLEISRGKPTVDIYEKPESSRRLSAATSRGVI